MRFEIKAGGWILIGLGLGGLSFIVFALGLFAGYDMARNTAPETSQAASVYPLPSPPPAPDLAKAPSKSSEEAAPRQSVAAKAAGNTKPSNATDSGAPSLSMDKNAGPIAVPPARTVANAGASVSAPKVPPSETASEEKPRAPKPVVTNPPDKYASAAESSGGRRKPFNIQIDAVMDRANAEQMTARLQKLGYHAFMVPTDISGQTWWRVRVGPYQSEDDASVAEQELREKYKNTYAP